LLGLEVAVSYHRYAKVLRWLTLSLGAYVVVLFVVQVDWAQVLRSTFVPTLRWSRTEITALIAIFGTTISPYLFFWQTSEEVEEIEDANDRAPRARGDRAVAVDRGHVNAMRADVFSGMASAIIVMWAIMVSTGATLGAHGVATVQTADQAARAFRPIAGSIAGLLFALGIVGTGALAVPVLAGSTAYALSEATGRKEGLGKTLRQAPIFYLIIAAAMLIGLGLNFSGVNPVRALYFAAVLNGLAAPPLILLMLLLSNSRATVGEWTGGRVSNALVGVTFVVMTGLPIAFLLAR
jgi:Mn2+/Fe2+ NRAMP family transporter